MNLLIKKAFRDFTDMGIQAVVAFLSVVLGMTFFGLMLFSDAVNNREIKAVYQKANPSSFTMTVSGNKTEDEIKRVLDGTEGVGEYTIRPVVMMELKDESGDWKSAYIFGVDFDKDNDINEIRVLEGKETVPTGQAYIENGATGVAGTGANSSVTLRDANGATQTIELSGLVNDMFVHPAYIHKCVYLYVPKGDITKYGSAAYQLLVKNATGVYDAEIINKVSKNLSEALTDTGITVTEVNLPANPGESMHADEYKSTLYLLRVFSFASLIFGGIIISTLLAAIFSTKVKQLGILKSTGVTTSQIIAAYMIAFGAIIIVAAIVSMVLSLVFSGQLCTFLLSLGNIMSDNLSVPQNTLLLFCIVILVLPMLSLIIPLTKGTKVSVKDAICDYGITVSTGDFENLPFIGKIKRPAKIAIRNVFVKRKQFLTNICFICIGGLLFTLVMTTSGSLKDSLNSYLDCLHYDYEFSADSETLEKFKDSLTDIGNISDYEVWTESACMESNETNNVSNMYKIVAIPENSSYIDIVMEQGCWPDPKDLSFVAISEAVAEKSQKNVGDVIELNIEGQKREFKISGVVRVFEEGIIYFSPSQLEQFTNEDSRSFSVKCQLESLGFYARDTIRKLEKNMEASGIRTLDGKSKQEMGAILSDHYSVTLNSLLVVTILLIIILCFGVSASLGIQMRDRRKEIGVLKSIGATERRIIRMISLESLVFALIAVVTVAVLGIPVVLFGCKYFSIYVLEEEFALSWLSFFTTISIWVAMCISLVFASYRRPAKQYAKTKIKEAFE